LRRARSLSSPRTTERSLRASFNVIGRALPLAASIDSANRSTGQPAASSSARHRPPALPLPRAAWPTESCGQPHLSPCTTSRPGAGIRPRSRLPASSARPGPRRGCRRSANVRVFLTDLGQLRSRSRARRLPAPMPPARSWWRHAGAPCHRLRVSVPASGNLKGCNRVRLLLGI
jgi:hypothetical protein